MDEQENLMVDEEMTDGIEEETNQDEQNASELGEKGTEVAGPSEAEGKPNAEAEEESKSGQSAESGAERDFERDSVDAIKRRERERKEDALRERIEKKAYQKGLIDAVGGVNPYTNEPIKDSFDVEEYLVMRDIEKNGGDPVNDYAKTLKNRQRTAEAAIKTRDKATSDLEEFKKTYPNVDVSRLLSDTRFARFAGKRIDGGENISEVYADYLSFTSDMKDRAEKEAEIKVKNQEAKKAASPGSLTGGGGEAKRRTLDDLSDEAFEKMIAKAKSGALKKS